jgi:hypothetical protein
MKTPRGILLSLLGCTLALALASQRAQAQTALQFSNDGGFANGFTGTLGWQFTANQNLTLTAFGIYNAGQPITTPHQVGLFDISGALLASGLVGPTSGDSMDGFFDFAPTASYNLLSGQPYIIGELLTADDFFYYAPSSITTDPGISYVQTQYDASNTPSLTFPSATDFPGNGYGYFGPNFLVESTVATATPEPAASSAFAVFLVGGLLRWGRVCRRSVSRNKIC